MYSSQKQLADGGGFGPWRCGSGRRALTGEGGQAGAIVFGGCRACHFFIYIWGFATKELESFVPAYTSSCIFSEKLRRCWREGSYVGSRTLVFLVAVICCPGHMTTQKLI